MVSFDQNASLLVHHESIASVSLKTGRRAKFLVYQRSGDAKVSATRVWIAPGLDLIIEKSVSHASKYFQASLFHILHNKTKFLTFNSLTRPFVHLCKTQNSTEFLFD